MRCREEGVHFFGTLTLGTDAELAELMNFHYCSVTAAGASGFRVRCDVCDK